MTHSASELSIRDNTVCREMLPVFYRRDPGNSFKSYIHISRWPNAPNSRIDSQIEKKTSEIACVLGFSLWQT